MTKAAKKEAVAEATAPAATTATESETDECKCAHFRRQHSGRGEKKKCTAKVFQSGALGDGKCDCVEFRRREPCE